MVDMEGIKGNLEPPPSFSDKYISNSEKILKNIKKSIFQNNKDKFQNLLQLRFKI